MGNVNLRNKKVLIEKNREKPSHHNHQKNGVGRAIAALLIAVTPASLVYQNYEANEWVSTMHQDGPMFEDAKKCPPLPTVRQSPDGTIIVSNAPKSGISAFQAKDTLITEEEQKDIKSAAENFETNGVNVISTGLQWVDIFVNKQFSFKSRISGVNFDIYSDRPNAFGYFNTEIFDELAHATLSEDVTYSHVGAQALVDCMQWRLVDPEGPRDIEGEGINVFIPSKYGVCWRDALIQDKPQEVPYGDFCDSSGGTLMDLSLRAGPFTHDTSWSVLMASNSDPAVARRSLSVGVVHELGGHAWPQKVGMPFKLDPNEQAADLIENEAIAQLYPNGLPLFIDISNNG